MHGTQRIASAAQYKETRQQADGKEGCLLFDRFDEPFRKVCNLATPRSADLMRLGVMMILTYNHHRVGVFGPEAL